MKAVIVSLKDGDSGEIIIRGRRKAFRLDNVNSPEKLDAGYDLATNRARRMLKRGDVVDINTTSKDIYDRVVVKMWKGGINVNKSLEAKNRLFRKG